MWNVLELAGVSLVRGGKVTVVLDDKEQVKLEFIESDPTPPAAPQETIEVE